MKVLEGKINERSGDKAEESTETSEQRGRETDTEQERKDKARGSTQEVKYTELTGIPERENRGKEIIQEITRQTSRTETQAFTDGRSRRVASTDE